MSLVCWRSSISVGDTNRLNMKADSIIGYRQETFEAVMKRTLKKLLSFIDNCDHLQPREACPPVQEQFWLAWRHVH